jgi:uncharacterized membrane protein HdeD (DUF308 family)
MTSLEAFLLGMVATASLVSGVFFLKFWRSSKDILFLAFAAFFLLDGAERIALVLFVQRANEGAWWVYAVRILALLGIIAAIVRKNYGGRD